MIKYILPFTLFLTGCTPDPVNNVIVDAPTLQVIHPVRKNEIYVPEKITWKSVTINNNRLYAISEDDQIELFKFIESLKIYNDESIQMLCYYENTEACDELKKKEKILQKHDDKAK